MDCSAIMTLNPKTVTENETVAEAAKELLAQREINLAVVDGAGRLAGLFGLGDLLALLAPRVALAGDLLPNLRFLSEDEGELRAKYTALKHRPVGAAIGREPVCVHPETPVSEALRLFGKGGTSLPVVERGSRRLLGMVSYWDAVRAVTDGGR